MKPAILISLASLALGVAAPLSAQDWDYGRANVPQFAPAVAGHTRAPKVDVGGRLEEAVLAGGLEHPWGIAVLPEGGYLVTERPGRLRHVAEDGTVSAPIAGLPRILARGQGGLLDVALAEDFAQSRAIYITYAKPVRGGSATAAARAVLSADMRALREVRDIFVQTPGSPTAAHYGSRVVPHGGSVYITTGEHSSQRERVYAQHLDKTYGKVIRVTPDGRSPDDNPFVGVARAQDEIWTLGHRNVQGAALDGQGRLWTLEHGPAGGDELNLIAPGRNYGWPEVSYGERYNGGPIGDGIPRAAGFEEPVYYWDPVIAPGGFVFYDGAMFGDWQGDAIVASLNPGGIVRLEIDGGRVTGEARYRMGAARIRDIAIAADGAILALVDDPNGAILRLTPADPS